MHHKVKLKHRLIPAYAPLTRHAQYKGSPERGPFFISDYAPDAGSSIPPNLAAKSLRPNLAAKSVSEAPDQQENIKYFDTKTETFASDRLYIDNHYQQRH